MQNHIGSISELQSEARALITGEPNLVANLSNLSALIFHSVGRLNWCGFYLRDSTDEMVLGPFQGKPACIRIKKGKGVCGTAWSESRTLNVPDVHAITNHIACDAASRSELVIPIFSGGEFRGVLDLDSPEIDRFDHQTQELLERVVKDVVENLFI